MPLRVQAKWYSNSTAMMLVETTHLTDFEMYLYLNTKVALMRYLKYILTNGNPITYTCSEDHNTGISSSQLVHLHSVDSDKDVAGCAATCQSWCIRFSYSITANFLHPKMT